MAHGGGEEALGGGFGAEEGAADAAFVEHEDAVAHAHEFGKFAGDEDDGFSGVGELVDDLVDFELCAHVDAARGFVEKDDARAGHERFAEDDFLLVAAGADPFANLLGDSAPAGGAKAGAGVSGTFDDFSDLAPGGAAPMRIDEIFGGSKGQGGIGGDPLNLGPLGDPLHQPNTSSSDDPFASLQSMPVSSVKPRSDHVPIGSTGYTPPRVQFDDETGQLIDPRRVPAAPMRQTPAAAPVPAPRAVPAPAGILANIPAHTPANIPAASHDALYAAFLRGVKSTHQMPAELTPELMERIGSLLHSATEGTLHLLLTRTELKRGLHADVTMIAAQANNPLKFSPTVEVALAHLLGNGVRGFMAPEVAMRDAYDDLRAHEFGVMVGMRAALAHLISRFTPDELEKKIAAKSALDALFSSNRKAKLWDQFVALSSGIAAEAEDDFHSLFGKAFLKAYEEQMARLKANR